MRILCLYNNDCALKIFQWIESEGHECIYWKDKIDIDWLKGLDVELAISYTYSTIIKADVIDFLDGNVVNIHNSYLPYNRGSDPNMWSLIDDSPRGVTLHYIDEKIDRGFIIDQILLMKPDLNKATLKTTYDELDCAAFELFKRAFLNYKHWSDMKKKAIGTGSYHSDKQGDELRNCITSYDMSVAEFLDRVGFVMEK